jgi:hypothetical protein
LFFSFSHDEDVSRQGVPVTTCDFIVSFLPAEFRTPEPQN